MKLVIGTVVILGAMGAVLTVAIIQGKIPELEVSEVRAYEGPAGDVKMLGTIHSILTVLDPLRFEVRGKGADAKAPHEVIVVEGSLAKPDNFKVGNEVTVQGTFDTLTDVFTANRIWTACPSKYEESQAFRKKMKSDPDFLKRYSDSDEYQQEVKSIKQPAPGKSKLENGT